MSPIKNVRIHDNYDLLNFEGGDFVVRKHGMTFKTMCRLMLVSIAIATVISLVAYKNQLLIGMMCIVGGFVLLIVGRKMEAKDRHINATQFLNALFASVLSHNHAFNIIISTGGEIIYLNRDFQILFPEFMAQPLRQLGLLLTMYGIPDAQLQAVQELIKSNHVGTIPVKLTGQSQQLGNVALSVEPIKRPAGYVLIRGKRL